MGDELCMTTHVTKSVRRSDKNVREGMNIYTLYTVVRGCFRGKCIMLHAVEPLNNKHVWARPFFLNKEVILSSEVYIV